MEKYTCPCCGYRTLDRFHDYQICTICYWEDDPYQFENIDETGANHVSLRLGQKNYKRFGACEKDMCKYIRKPNKNDVYDEPKIINEKRIITVQDLNGDSTIMGLSYKDGLVSCIFTDGETEERYKIKLKTNILYSEIDSEEESVHISIYDLKNYIPIDIKSGIYTAPDNFGMQMDINRKSFHLAYGKKHKEYPFFIKIQGYKTILASPIRSLDDIIIECIDD